ncbi:hypothetical protein Y032_0745g2009 [Ancylostoma ceylanicum]|uniref:Uncharacterized protein n=1 Tax=Ancylostoma ceylanicum TaxID=53326 RepID=A0A016WE41_9BILA|nr:hypothetical protein Y032_0745g2009 [Ancylostoma ceylanicum]
MYDQIIAGYISTPLLLRTDTKDVRPVGTYSFAELMPHVIEARIAKMGGVGVSFQLLFGSPSLNDMRVQFGECLSNKLAS